MHPPLPGLPHFAAEGEGGHLPAHERRAGAARPWDYKPKLAEYFDKDLPDSIRNGQRITTMTSGQARFPVAPSMFKFAQHGQCGTLGQRAAAAHGASSSTTSPWSRRVHTNAINHDPACTFVMTGSEVPGKPSIGSWLAYGLGSESNDLPAFVVFTPIWSSERRGQALFTRMWASGFLPGKYSGVALRSVGDPVLYVQNPPASTSDDRRAMLDTLGELNQPARSTRFGDPETQTRIAQYEMAFRMQTSVPELTDLSKRAAGDARPVRPGRDEARHVRRQRAAGPAAGRARRARRADPAPRLGPARQPAAATSGSQCKDTDQPTAAARARPQAARAARRHAGRLGRRVRPHGLFARAR